MSNVDTAHCILGLVTLQSEMPAIIKLVTHDEHGELHEPDRIVDSEVLEAINELIMRSVDKIFADTPTVQCIHELFEQAKVLLEK